VRRLPSRVSRLHGDHGTMIPLIMLCCLLAGTFVCGSIAASAAFLAQRDLAGDCDGAALAAANAFDRAAAGAEPADSLPLSDQSVAVALTRYARNSPQPTTMAAETDGRVVTVICRRVVVIPFGRLLGYRDGLERTAVAHARSPLD
jgi:hypothetical protein